MSFKDAIDQKCQAAAQDAVNYLFPILMQSTQSFSGTGQVTVLQVNSDGTVNVQTNTGQVIRNVLAGTNPLGPGDQTILVNNSQILSK